MKTRVVSATTKRGRPARAPHPLTKKNWKSPKGAWIGKVKIVGDIVNFDSAHLWFALAVNDKS